ncbi:MAG: c-type cytochrome [Curvibacter sp.]|nr:MAG: c-type cytochrome [Curvibacter sp.]
MLRQNFKRLWVGLLWASLVPAFLVACAEEPSRSTTGQTAEHKLLRGSAVRGQSLYGERCAGCHSVDANDAGPMHRGVLGRTAGTVPGFEYSSALRASGLVWTRQSLDAWLRDPEALVPGQAMDEQVAHPQDRQDLIAYLATLR